MMKNMAVAGAALAMTLAAGSVCAAGLPQAGTFGVNVAVGTAGGVANNPDELLITGKYLFARDMAVLAGVGLQFVDTGAATNNKSTDIGLMGGFRKYLSTEDLAPFVGGQLHYVSTKPGGTDVTTFMLYGEAGVEYFLSKQFSVEGSVFVGYASQETKPAVGASTKATVFGTSKANLSVNFYF